MFLSKDWKWRATAEALVLAPVMVTFLTACPGRKTANTGPVSPYTGYWLNVEAKRDYDQAKRQGGRFQQVFCPMVQANPSLHGCPTNTRWDGELQIQAWQVSAGGDVYEWSPTLNLQDASSRDSYYVGHVRDDGFFTKETDDSSAARGQAYYSAYNPNTAWAQTANLSIRGDLLHVYRNDGGRERSDRNFVRVSDDTLRDYVDNVDACARSIYGAPVQAPPEYQTQQQLPQQYDPRTSPPPQVRRQVYQQNVDPNQQMPAPEVEPLPQ